jgi:GxxExxY protein
VTDETDLLTERIIGCAIETHRVLGPGSLESAYETALAHELANGSIGFRRQVVMPLDYKGTLLDCGYRLDCVVEEKVILEIKSVDQLLPIHEAQLLTYLKLSGIRTGLLINFNVRLLKHGLKRLVL